MNLAHLGLLATLLATSATGQDPADQDQAAGADRHRVSGVEIAAVVEGQNQFALDLYARLHERPGNLCFSPLSLAAALTMAHAGAHGETAEQIARVLHLPADGGSAGRASGALLRGLSGDAGPRGVQLTWANSLWAAKQLGLLPEFASLLQERYASAPSVVDFQGDPESARRAINGWIGAHTDGKVPEFFQPGVIDGHTQLVLANALTFRGRWAAAFQKERTQPGAFRLSPGRQVQVPFMQQTGKFRRAATDFGEILELPYSGHDVAFLLLLPRQADRLAELEKRLTASSLAEWTRRLKPESLVLSLPRFAIDRELHLEDDLSELGMPRAFRPDAADFSGLCSAGQPVALSEVAQRVRIQVDETGTEAQAATAVRSARGLGDSTVRELKADHPFVFLLRDLRTGSILFLGRLSDPAPRARDDR
ncbi:MAG TPA: serpin family protein [Isosphaeraceae bacterium]|nr:serpin family protein [Isosphaeraceae bacterium]